MKRSRRSIADWLGLVIPSGLIAGGVYFLWLGVSWGWKFDRWVTEEPVCVRVVLGPSVTVEAPFKQTCAIAHSQSINLRPVDPADVERLKAAREQIVLVAHVTKAGDSKEYGYAEGVQLDSRHSGYVGIELLRPAPDGAYTFRAEIAAIPGLDHLPADLVIRNELCGLEKMPSLFGYVIGVVLVFVGGVTALLASARRSKRRVAIDSSGATPSPPP